MKFACKTPLTYSSTLFLACTLVGCAEEEVVIDSKSEVVEQGRQSTNDSNLSEDIAQKSTERMKETQMAEKTTPKAYNELTEFEASVLRDKGTERAWVGEYTDTEDAGTYICRQCNAALYNSDHKFHSNCGWPAFDDEIPGAVERHRDADGVRVEIVCNNCKGHLGHVFEGERMTDKNIRHCVNSVSMVFVPDGDELPKVIKLDE